MAASYFTKFDSPGLHRLELSSNDETPVPGTETLADAVSWSVDGEGVLFVGFESGGMRLFGIEPKGAVRKLGLIDSDPGGGLVLDRSRGRVLFTRRVRSESDRVLAALPAS